MIAYITQKFHEQTLTTVSDVKKDKQKKNVVWTLR